MNDRVSPYSANMHHVVAMEPAERNFIGRKALEEQLAKGVNEKLVGLVLEERGVLRHGQPVRIDGVGEGTITSGSHPRWAKRLHWHVCLPIQPRRGEVESVAAGFR